MCSLICIADLSVYVHIYKRTCSTRERYTWRSASSNKHRAEWHRRWPLHLSLHIGIESRSNPNPNRFETESSNLIRIWYIPKSISLETRKRQYGEHEPRCSSLRFFSLCAMAIEQQEKVIFSHFE